MKKRRFLRFVIISCMVLAVVVAMYYPRELRPSKKAVVLEYFKNRYNYDNNLIFKRTEQFSSPVAVTLRTAQNTITTDVKMFRHILGLNENASVEVEVNEKVWCEKYALADIINAFPMFKPIKTRCAKEGRYINNDDFDRKLVAADDNLRHLCPGLSIADWRSDSINLSIDSFDEIPAAAACVVKLYEYVMDSSSYKWVAGMPNWYSLLVVKPVFKNGARNNAVGYGIRGLKDGNIEPYINQPDKMEEKLRIDMVRSLRSERARNPENTGIFEIPMETRMKFLPDNILKVYVKGQAVSDLIFNCKALPCNESSLFLLNMHKKRFFNQYNKLFPDKVVDHKAIETMFVHFLDQYKNLTSYKKDNVKDMKNMLGMIPCGELLKLTGLKRCWYDFKDEKLKIE